MFSKIMRPRTLLILILLMAVAALTYGFAATLNLTSNETIVGSGSSTLVDYSADVDWTLNSSDPSDDPNVEIDFGSNAPVEVYFGYSSDNTNWTWIDMVNDTTNCSYSGSVFECDLAGATVINIKYIQVVASGPNS